jgi:4-phosphopantoate--beta-alanine ligase
MKIPKGHPRYRSLKERHALIEGYEKGITTIAGLIAQGRGEAFDYLIGETTNPPAQEAIKASAATLLLAKNPVISVNGNTAVLCPSQLVRLAKECNAKLEINLFYRSEERVRKIKEILMKKGAPKVYGIDSKKIIPGVHSERKWAEENGIYTSDVVFVSLEDGDRTEALVNAKKKVIAVDLNPLSRTALKASITIVDNVTRALPKIVKSVLEMKKMKKKELVAIVDDFDNSENLRKMLKIIGEGLNRINPL